MRASTMGSRRRAGRNSITSLARETGISGLRGRIRRRRYWTQNLNTIRLVSDLHWAFHIKANVKKVVPLVFEPLPLGSTKPLGWLKQQMELMAEGMPGRMHEFYRLVKDAPWMGGDHEYSPLNEAYSYYFDGIVPLAYGLDDERLKDHVLRSADWLIGHQHEDGWFGPEIDLERRNFWGRYPLFLGFIQLAEAETRLESAIVASLHRFIDLMHEMLSDGHQGYVWKPGDLFDEQWGRSRAADMIIALQWLYEKHPHENAEKIHDCMIYMYEMAYDWSYWFSEDVFLKDDLDLFPVEVTNSFFPYVHVVNAAQGLKSPAVMRRINHDESLLNTTRNGRQLDLYLPWQLLRLCDWRRARSWPSSRSGHRALQCG